MWPSIFIDQFVGAVKQELPNGSLWQLCWRMDDRTGLPASIEAAWGLRERGLDPSTEMPRLLTDYKGPLESSESLGSLVHSAFLARASGSR